MISALTRVTSRRVWFVPHFGVWGAPDWSDVDYLAVEEIDSVKSVMFDRVSIGESTQSVKFCDLIDRRGNSLPDSIANPVVVARPRTSDAVFVVGEETSEGFKIARSSASSGPVTVDLMIIELGQ